MSELLKPMNHSRSSCTLYSSTKVSLLLGVLSEGGRKDVILPERIGALAKLLNVAFEIGTQDHARFLGNETTAAEAELELLVLWYHKPRRLRIPRSC